MTGLEFLGIAVVVAVRAAITPKRKLPTQTEIVARTYLADRRIDQIRSDAVRDLRDLDRRGQRRRSSDV
jgi:hypothetical protein